MYKDEKFWDRIASKFDRIEQNDPAYKIFIEKARAYLKADDTILDFGCGTGLICNEKFKPGSLDAIIAFNVFHLLEDPQTHFQRIYQILKPGGLIISSTPCMSETQFLNTTLKLFSLIGITPKLTSFTGSELKQMLLNESFKTIEFGRIKPKSPIYLCILEKQS